MKFFVKYLYTTIVLVSFYSKPILAAQIVTTPFDTRFPQKILSSRQTYQKPGLPACLIQFNSWGKHWNNAQSVRESEQIRSLVNSLIEGKNYLLSTYTSLTQVPESDFDFTADSDTFLNFQEDDIISIDIDIGFSDNLYSAEFKILRGRYQSFVKFSGSDYPPGIILYQGATKGSNIYHVITQLQAQIPACYAQNIQIGNTQIYRNSAADAERTYRHKNIKMNYYFEW